MDIYRAERLAQDMAVHGGDWNKSFVIAGPSGLIECEWLDPHFGIFQMKGHEGFVMTKQIPEGLEIIMPDDVSAVATTERNDG
jgi:hypothetical protein